MSFRIPHPVPFSPQLAPVDVPSRAAGPWALPRLLSTNAFPGGLSYPVVRRACRQTGSWVGRVVRESGLPQRWHFIPLLAILSFLVAWAGTRAVMAGFEETWSEITLPAAMHENQAFRVRQESLREETEATLARLETQETTHAGTP